MFLSEPLQIVLYIFIFYFSFRQCVKVKFFHVVRNSSKNKHTHHYYEFTSLLNDLNGGAFIAYPFNDIKVSTFSVNSVIHGYIIRKIFGLIIIPYDNL